MYLETEIVFAETNTSRALRKNVRKQFVLFSWQNETPNVHQPNLILHLSNINLQKSNNTLPYITSPNLSKSSLT